MTEPHKHIALPLELFFTRLHTAGFRMDTARKLRLLRALHQHAGRHVGRIGDLKYALAPFVATTPDEQRRFHDFFDAFLIECDLEAGQWAGGHVPPPPPPPPPGFWKKYRRPLAGLLLLLALVAAVPVIREWLRPPAPALPPARIEFSAPDDNIRREGQQKPFRNATTGIHPDSCRWTVRDAETGALEHADTALHLDWTARGYGRTKKITLDAGTRGRDSVLVDIHCATPPQMPAWTAPEPPLVQGRAYTFAAAPVEKNARVQWYLIWNAGSGIRRDTILKGAKIRHVFDGNGPAAVTCRIYFNEKDCYAEETRPFAIGADKPLLPLAGLQYDTPRAETRLKLWVWLLFLLPVLYAARLWWLWWKKYREQPALKSDAELADAYPLHDKAPYFIPYLPQDGKISVPPGFFRMAEVLRRRAENERREVDVPASARATAQNGGFPTLVERRDTTPPDYLFLIERPGAQYQQGRLFERLASFLQKQDAPLTAYYHDGNYRTFWNDQKPGGVSFDYLHQQYPGYRLVLIGTGHALSNPYDTRRPALRRAPLEALSHWKKALFLSTEPVSAWRAPEVLLHQHFLLYPADTAGILAGFEALDALEEHEPGPYLKWEAALAKSRPDPNPHLCLWETVAQHRDFLDAVHRPPSTVYRLPSTVHRPPSTDFKWLCGLAVAVQPDFALTVAIGKKMGVEVSHDALLRLSRIPWLNQNEPDTRLRLELLACLSPEEERLARQAAAEELEAAREGVAGGYAELDWKTNLSIHRFALDPLDPEHRRTLRELLQLGLLSEGQLRELDGIVQRRLDPAPGRDRDEGAMQGDAGARFSEYLDEKPFLPREIRAALSLIVLSLGLLSLGLSWQHHWKDADPKQAPPLIATAVTVTDSALLWHNEAVRMAMKIGAAEDYSVWAPLARDTAPAAQNLFRAADIRYKASVPLIDILNATRRDTNWLHFQLNMAAQRFNFYQGSVPFLEAFTLSRAGIYDLAAGRMGEMFTLDSIFRVLSRSENQAVSRTALHANGICQFYFHEYARRPGALDSAYLAYNELMRATDSLYFDTLSMPVNLRTLLFPALAAQSVPGQCRVVAGSALALRARSLSQPEYEEIQKNRGGALDLQTFVATIPAGETVALLDSVRLSYHIRYKGRAGYVPIFFNDKPTLLPCGSAGAAPAAGLDMGQILADINRSMKPVQGGKFMMGCLDEKRDGDCSDAEKPAREVEVAGFYIGATEVTIAQYLIFCDETRTHYPEWLEPGNEYNIETGTNDYYKTRGMSRDNKTHPVTGVSWNDAVAYCEWLSRKTGRKYRLPTEAEWEYAARGGPAWQDGFRYAGSNDVAEVAWYSGNAGGRTHPAAGKKPNQLGLYDISGNVWEWCQDAWHGNYEGAPKDGRAWMEGGSEGTAVLRGGSWDDFDLNCRAAYRDGDDRINRNIVVGFRLARDGSAGGR